VVCAFLHGSPVAAQVGARLYEPERVAGVIPQQPYLRYRTTDALRRTIVFYVSEEAGASPLPLLVYVHGSGATSHFVQEGDRVVGRNGHSTVRDVAAGRARLVIVEKPGVEYLSDAPAPGGAAAASETFRYEHTLNRWAEAVTAALRAARRLPGVDSSRVLVVGHSEGGLVAAVHAAEQEWVTHVAMLAGGGPSQLYDLLVLARRGLFFADRGETPDARERYVMDAWERIQASPESADSLFFGHPYRRWSSFLSRSPMQALGNTHARIYLTQGTRDEAVTLESFEMLCSQLRSQRADVVCDRAEGADHNFAYRAGEGPADGWAAAWTRVLEWYSRH
jgi:predicted esterase